MQCLHCGLPAPPGESYCCPGCESVAASIASLGLGDYYRLRTATPAPPAATEAGLAAFDDGIVQAKFVRRDEHGSCEADLLVDGLRCAACSWLVERALERVPGVTGATVNFTLRRAHVRWNPSAAAVSSIIGAVRAVGYDASPYEESRVAQVEARERRGLLRRLWVAGLGMMQVMMYAVPAYIAGEGDMTADVASLMRWAGLVLTLPVVVYSAAPFFGGAARGLRNGRLGMDVPIALGIAVAFAASAWATIAASGPVYFDSVTMFVFLLLGARYLELGARSRAARSLQHLARVEARSAERLRPGEGHATDTVAAVRLVPGDRVLVRTGETLPADGILEGPEALVSEAWLTGESRPHTRRPRDELRGGSVNAGRALVLEVRRVGADTAIASIQRMMQRALDERPPWVEMAERASGPFVALVLAAALAAALAWSQVDPSRALWIAVSVLVVTCPCALALATPTALVVASGAMARRNVVVTRAGAIERLAAATDLVFDKTGTLTEGRPRLLQVDCLGIESESQCRVLAAALARASSHPLDRALADLPEGIAVPAAHEHCNHAGEGVEALIGARRVRMGRREFVSALHGRPAPDTASSDARTTVWLGDDHGWIAALRMGDALRPEAAGAVRELGALGYGLHLLSGDGEAVVRETAQRLGIKRWMAGATPRGKREFVRALQARGARVAMVGDGINDAPVLAQADVSIAMGGGADLAQLRADAVLLSDSLADLAAAACIARRTRIVVRQNIAWALAYNGIAIPMAFAGWVTPLAAGVAMAASSLIVVANALRLRR